MKVEIVIMENYEEVRQREQDPALASTAPIEPKYYHAEYSFRISHLNSYTLDTRNEPVQLVANIGGDIRNIVYDKEVHKALDYELNHR